MTTIIPRYKVIYTYDVQPHLQGEYSQFVLGEFVPALHGMGLYLTGAFFTVYGEYPGRFAEFVTETLDIMRHGLESERYEELERQLRQYTFNFRRKVVRYRSGFQF